MGSEIKFSLDDENYARLLSSDPVLEKTYMNGYQDGLKMARLALLKMKQVQLEALHAQGAGTSNNNRQG